MRPVTLLNDPVRFRGHLLRKLDGSDVLPALFPGGYEEDISPSSVMLLLGRRPAGHENGSPSPHGRKEICIVLNKRSRRVRQAGDLCCPGGTVEPELDPWLARILMLPGSPLSMWPHWGRLKQRWPGESQLLALLLATGLRESWEEMRLNPLGVRFLGFLRPQRLRLYQRVIYPMVGWIYFQKRFVPSWEVESVVSIPLRSLLRPEQYALYRLHIAPELEQKFPEGTQDYPCFIHEDERGTEILWGATYWIVTWFLERVFGFVPPSSWALPLVPGILDDGYIFGRCACVRLRGGFSIPEEIGNGDYRR
jgi:hypothetical protein